MNDPSLSCKIYNLLQNKPISIIVPAYNETHLAEKLQKLTREITPFFKNYEIIIVIDGGPKIPTKEISALNNPHIQVFHYKDNRGKGFALRYGALRSTGNLIVFLDGGMELHPRDIKRFCLLMDIYEADIVIGSKRHPFSDVNYPVYRKIFSAGCQFLIKLIFRIRFVKDSQVGLKLFKRNVLETILPKTTYNDYAFDIELLVLAYKYGFKKILEAPVKLEFTANEKGKPLKEFKKLTKISLQVLHKIFLLVYRWKFSKFYQKINNENWGIPKELQTMPPINNLRLHQKIKESKITLPSKMPQL